jgi:hypothetical protein
MNCPRLSPHVAIVLFSVASPLRADTAPAPAEKSFKAPHAQAISVKMIGPVTQTADLQILCILKHDSNGDKYIEAMDDFNKKLHGLLSALRDRGEFVGELGETILFTPPPNSITPKRVLLIGVGDEAGLNIERLKLVGRIAVREAARLKASHVSFAPGLRDQGSSRIDVGEGDAAFAGEWVLAYDTDKKMQEQGFAPSADVSWLTIEAGPRYFEGAAAKISDAIQSATEAVQKRNTAPYANN